MSQKQLLSTERLDLPNGFEVTEKDERSILIDGPRKGEYISIKQSGTKPHYHVTHRTHYVDRASLSDPYERDMVGTWDMATEWVQERINQHPSV